MLMQMLEAHYYLEHSSSNDAAAAAAADVYDDVYWNAISMFRYYVTCICPV